MLNPTITDAKLLNSITKYYMKIIKINHIFRYEIQSLLYVKYVIFNL